MEPSFSCGVDVWEDVIAEVVIAQVRIQARSKQNMCVLSSILGVSRFSACTRRGEMAAALCRPRRQLKAAIERVRAYVPRYAPVDPYAGQTTTCCGRLIPASFLRPMRCSEQMCYTQAPLMF